MSRVPCATKFSPVTCFIHSINSVYTSIPISQFILSPLGIHTFVFYFCLQISSAQFSHFIMSDSATPWTAACQASLSITNSWKLLKLMSIKSVMPSNHLIPFSSCLQSCPGSGSFPKNQLFTSDGQSIGVSSSASVLSMNIQDWFFFFFFYNWQIDLLVVQGTLKSLLQYHSSKSSILWHSAL